MFIEKQHKNYCISIYIQMLSSSTIETLYSLRDNIVATKLSCHTPKIHNTNEDSNTIKYMLDSFIQQIDTKIMSECKHSYYETLVQSSIDHNKHIHVTKCHNCSTVFPYSRSKL
jgi:hypothetical protein